MIFRHRTAIQQVCLAIVDTSVYPVGDEKPPSPRGEKGAEENRLTVDSGRRVDVARLLVGARENQVVAERAGRARELGRDLRNRVTIARGVLRPRRICATDLVNVGSHGPIVSRPRAKRT